MAGTQLSPIPVPRRSRGPLPISLAVAAIAWLGCDAQGLPLAAALAEDGACSSVAALQHDACYAEARADLLTARAICTNISDATKRANCLASAGDDHADARAECDAQNAARGTLCAAIGEAPYEPDFAPAHYDADFAHLTNPNPYFPIAVGNQWRYKAEGETVVVEVLDQVKSIQGVPCIVFHDEGLQDGYAAENTFDWVGQNKDGSVTYCGEISRSYHVFPNDTPPLPELVSIDGSWKAGREGDKPGLLFPATPGVGMTYRQELSLGDAEDSAEVLSVNYKYGDDAVLDQFVPKALARRLCAEGDCVVTREFSPVEPDDLERKYYARGIGLFLTTEPATGGAERLVSCNMDPKCANLP